MKFLIMTLMVCFTSMAVCADLNKEYINCESEGKSYTSVQIEGNFLEGYTLFAQDNYISGRAVCEPLTGLSQYTCIGYWKHIRTEQGSVPEILQATLFRDIKKEKVISVTFKPYYKDRAYSFKCSKP